MTADTAAPELLRFDPFFRGLPQTHGFLEAAHETPDDDTPRLVLADWLEENGFPARAEFIRLQCGVGPGGQEGWSRERSLWEQHRAEWADGDKPGDLFHILSIQPEAFSCWQRGLYERASIPYVGAFVSHAERLLAKTPFRQIDLSGREFRQREGRPGAIPLRLHWVRELADCPQLRQLTMLGLCDRRIGAAGGALLAHSPHLHNLRELDLRENDLRNAGASSVFTSQSLDHLRRLLLGGNAVGDEGVRALRRSTGLPSLVELDLGNEAFRTAYGMALRGLPTPSPPELIERHQISDQGIEDLVCWPGLSHLRVLRLAGNRITDEGLTLLASCPHASRLESLDLADNSLTEKGVQALARSCHLTSLRQVNLPAMSIRPETKRLLAEVPWKGFSLSAAEARRLLSTFFRLA